MTLIIALKAEIVKGTVHSFVIHLTMWARKIEYNSIGQVFKTTTTTNINAKCV